MDDVINVFVQNTYTVEQQEDIYQALGIFRAFNYLDIFPTIEALLTKDSTHDSTSLTDGLTLMIAAGQDYLLDQHGIRLSDETTMAFNNVVLRVLLQVQMLEDPLPVLRVIENSESPEVKFATICAMYSQPHETSFLQVLELLRPVFLKNLANYLYAQEDGLAVATEDIPDIVEAVRLFKESFGINPVVRTILDIGTVMGENFELMIPLFNEFRELVTDEKVLVEALMFLLMMSSDGVKDPMGVFARYSSILVGDLTAADRLGRTLGEMYNTMTRLKESQIEKK